MSIKQLSIEVPEFNWLLYLNTFLPTEVSENELVVVYSTEYLKEMGKLIGETDTRTIHNYAVWRLVKVRKKSNLNSQSSFCLTIATFLIANSQLHAFGVLVVFSSSDSNLHSIVLNTILGRRICCKTCRVQESIAGCLSRTSSLEPVCRIRQQTTGNGSWRTFHSRPFRSPE